MNIRRASSAVGLVFSAVLMVSACADGSTTSSSAEPGSDATSDSSSGSSSSGSSSSGSSVPSASAPASASASTSIAIEGNTPVDSQIDPGLQPYIDIAVADLAQRLSIDAASIEVISATLQEWPDSALGCRQAGQQYAQVSTDGSLIVLTAGGNEYRYHSGGSRKPFYCEQSSKVPPVTL